MTFLVLWGTLGSVLDSVLGGLFQQSVKDIRSGKIVEGEGGVRALVSPEHDSAVEETKNRTTTDATATGGETKGAKQRSKKEKPRRPSFGDERPSRIIENGWDLLDNNDVNFIMAVLMSVGGMAVMGWYWDVPIQSVLDGVAY
jgi:uncharacterized membrane protein